MPPSPVESLATASAAASTGSAELDAGASGASTSALAAAATPTPDSDDDGGRNEAASLAATRQKAGRAVDMRDTQIAGIALARRATLATRNVRHFADLNVQVIDPWDV